MSVAQITEPRSLNSHGGQPQSQMQGVRRLPLELELTIVSFVPLDSSDDAGWLELAGYLRVCHAWNEALRKRMARELPLLHLVRYTRDAEVVNTVVRRAIAQIQPPLPLEEIPDRLNEVAEYVVLGAFPEALRLLLDAGVRADYRPRPTPYHSTLLHQVILGKLAQDSEEGVPRECDGICYSVDGERLKCVQLLLAHGFYIEAQGPTYGYYESVYTPLAVAVVEGRNEIAVELLKHGAEVNVHSGPLARRMSLPHHCAVLGHAALLSKLLTHEGPDGEAAAFHGLVESAIAWTDVYVFDLLPATEFASHINETEKWTQTPLETAVDRGNPLMVTKLVSLGADVHNRDLLARCADRGPLKMIETLVKIGAPVTPSVWPAFAGRPWKADFLLQCDPLLGAQALMGEWIKAIETGIETKSAVALLRVCLKHGADPNMLVDDLPCISMCIRDRSYDECEMLLQAGADPNLNASHKSMPLFIAVDCGFNSKVQLLHRFGATFAACPAAEHLASSKGPPSEDLGSNTTSSVDSYGG